VIVQSGFHFFNGDLEIRNPCFARAEAATEFVGVVRFAGGFFEENVTGNVGRGNNGGWRGIVRFRGVIVRGFFE
jgi:hypothetical protein